MNKKANLHKMPTGSKTLILTAVFDWSGDKNKFAYFGSKVCKFKHKNEVNLSFFTRDILRNLQNSS